MNGAPATLRRPRPRRAGRAASKRRRRLLRTLLLAGGVLGAALSGFLPLVYARRLRLRPPGALDEHDFLASCIKCGQCVQVCPVQAIKLADLVDGMGVGVPYIEPRSQSCDFSCDAAQCVLACPTGALTYEKENGEAVRSGSQLASKPVLKAKEQERDNGLNLRERMGVARVVRPESCLAALGKGFKGVARGPAFEGHLRYMEVDRWKPIQGWPTIPTTWPSATCACASARSRARSRWRPFWRPTAPGAASPSCTSPASAAESAK